MASCALALCNPRAGAGLKFFHHSNFYDTSQKSTSKAYRQNGSRTRRSSVVRATDYPPKRAEHTNDLPSPPHSHLASHHVPLPPNQQSTDKGRADAEVYYNPTDKPLSFTSTLPLLNSSYRIPRLGFGIYRSAPEVCTASCLTALKTGYRHIDSAQFYRNEKEMGVAARESGIPRSELFLTTKVMTPAGGADKTYEKCRDSVKKVVGELSKDGRTEKEDEYVDLFLIHTPNGGAAARKEMWLALERVYKEGLARHIGVSNFGTGHIAELKEYASVWPPVVNQIEVRVLFPARLLGYHWAH